MNVGHGTELLYTLTDREQSAALEATSSRTLNALLPVCIVAVSRVVDDNEYIVLILGESTCSGRLYNALYSPREIIELEFQFFCRMIFCFHGLILGHLSGVLEITLRQKVFSQGFAIPLRAGGNALLRVVITPVPNDAGRHVRERH